MQMRDAPECWGKFAEGADCPDCLYAAACRLFTETEPAMNAAVGGQDYDSVEDWAEDLADHSHTPGMEPEHAEDDAPAGSLDLAGFLMFLLRLDDYTLGILAEIIAPSQTGRRCSVADLARIHGISRQGMHRKVLDVARKSPELCSLLRMTVKKIQKARREFSAPRRQRRPSPQLEFRF